MLGRKMVVGDGAGRRNEGDGGGKRMVVNQYRSIHTQWAEGKSRDARRTILSLLSSNRAPATLW